MTIGRTCAHRERLCRNLFRLSRRKMRARCERKFALGDPRSSLSIQKGALFVWRYDSSVQRAPFSIESAARSKQKGAPFIPRADLSTRRGARRVRRFSFSVQRAALCVWRAPFCPQERTMDAKGRSRDSRSRILDAQSRSRGAESQLPRRRPLFPSAKTKFGSRATRDVCRRRHEGSPTSPRRNKNANGYRARSGAVAVTSLPRGLLARRVPRARLRARLGPAAAGVLVRTRIRQPLRAPSRCRCSRWIRARR